MMIDTLTTDKEIERDLLLNDPEINEMLRNIISIVEDRQNQIHSN